MCKVWITKTRENVDNTEKENVDNKETGFYREQNATLFNRHLPVLLPWLRHGDK